MIKHLWRIHQYCVLGLLLFATGSSAHAEGRHFRSNAHSFRVALPDDWTVLEDFQGVPFLLLGPLKDNQRQSLSIVPTGIRELTIDARDQQQALTEYKKGREAWLARVKGKSLEYLPYQNMKLPTVAEAHSLGYRYRIDSGEFIEKAFHFICRDQMYQLSSLTPAGARKDALLHLTESFRCE